MHSNYQTIKVELKKDLATVTLNRPEMKNALNGIMADELKNAFNWLSDDPQVKVIVLTGEGNAFCSGQDLNEFQDFDEISISEVLQKRYNPLIMSMHHNPKIIIGKINGVAAGAGLSLALACDFILAVETATFTMSFVNIGLVPDCGAAYYLPKLVGKAKAFELCTLGSKFSANDAYKMGMINILSKDAENLHLDVISIADKYANAPTQALGMIKQLLNDSYGQSLDKVVEIEAAYQQKAGITDDFKEGILAFREKRIPKFIGL